MENGEMRATAYTLSSVCISVFYEEEEEEGRRHKIAKKRERENKKE